MKTIQELQDDIQNFRLPTQPTGQDINNLLNILDNTLKVIQKMDSSIRRISNDLDEHLN